MIVNFVFERVYCITIDDVLGEPVPVADGLGEIGILEGVCVCVVYLVFV